MEGRGGQGRKGRAMGGNVAGGFQVSSHTHATPLHINEGMCLVVLYDPRTTHVIRAVSYLVAL